MTSFNHVKMERASIAGDPSFSDKALAVAFDLLPGLRYPAEGVLQEQLLVGAVAILLYLLPAEHYLLIRHLLSIFCMGVLTIIRYYLVCRTLRRSSNGTIIIASNIKRCEYA